MQLLFFSGAKDIVGWSDGGEGVRPRRPLLSFLLAVTPSLLRSPV